MSNLKSFALLLSLSMGLFSCRLGNHVIQPSTQGETKLEYFETGAQSLTFCTTVMIDNCDTNTGTCTQVPKDLCSAATPNMTPPFVSAAMTNPLRVISDPLTGEGYLAALNSNADYLPVIISKDESLNFLGGTKPKIAWYEPQCLYTLGLDETGKLHRTNGPWTSGMQNQYPLSGRVELNAIVAINFTGDCKASLKSMSSCIQDVTQCGGTTPSENANAQLLALEFFEPFLQSGTLVPSCTPENTQCIEKVKTLTYQVLYQ